MNDELKSLVEDAAKLLHFQYVEQRVCFNPLDPERGDLMKVADAADLTIRFPARQVKAPTGEYWSFVRGDHQSKVLAILRAASAVLHSRGGV